MSLGKMTLFRVFFTIFFTFSSVSVGISDARKCSGGVVLLNGLNNSEYIQEFNYDCTKSDLDKVVGRIRRKSQDSFVNYFLKDFKRSSDDEDDDYNNEEEEEGSGSEEDQGPVQVEPSTHYFVPILPTPTTTTMYLSTAVVTASAAFAAASSSLKYEPIIEATKVLAPASPLSSSVFFQERLLVGSGDGGGEVIMSTPVVFSSTTEEQVLLMKRVKLPKEIVQSGLKYNKSLDQVCIIGDPINWLVIEDGNLIGLPSNDDVSDYELKLLCEDKILELYLAVRQRQKSRNYNHVFEIEFGTVFKNVTGIVRLVEHVRGLGRPDTDLVVVSYDVSAFPYSLRFVNETIVNGAISTGSCPKEELRSAYESLQKVVNPPGYEVKAVRLLPNGLCDGKDIDEVVKRGGEKVVEEVHNYPPTVKNQIDQIHATVGRYLVYQIRNDFCYDPEDGETNRLKLSLKNVKDHVEFNESFWLRFDHKNQEIFGLPMKVQQFSAVLKCEDSKGKSANDVLEVKVAPPPVVDYSAEFSLHFESIPFTPTAIRKFLEKLTSSLSSEIQVKSYSESNNHVHFKWFNTSNPNSESKLTEIRKILFSDEGPLNKNIKIAFAPEFNLTSGGAVPVSGGLLGGSTPVNMDPVFDFDKETAADKKLAPDDDLFEDNNRFDQFDNAFHDSAYLTTYIIPSVLIAVMILLALIIACLLSRKNKSSTNEFTNEEHKKFLGGVPVIFQDELDKHEQHGFVHSRASAGPAPPEYLSQQQQHHPQQRMAPSYQPPPALMTRGGGGGGDQGLPSYHIHRTNKQVSLPYVPP